MRKKIVFGMAIISLVAIIVLCQKAGVRLKETFRESEETNSGAVIGMKEKENEKSDKKGFWQIANGITGTGQC